MVKIQFKSVMEEDIWRITDWVSIARFMPLISPDAKNLEVYKCNF